MPWIGRQHAVHFAADIDEDPVWSDRDDRAFDGFPARRWVCSNSERMSPKRSRDSSDASGGSEMLDWGMREKPDDIVLCHIYRAVGRVSLVSYKKSLKRAVDSHTR